ncbi:MAG TPA: inner membrane CreD family protein [Candidatus Acidoferrum sp.]|nr:inner membrane CreD family protein [Candidatus Acidoferrum sp.]
MFKRIAAICLIWVCTAVAWAILGTSIFVRTNDAQSGLSGRVASTWGAPQEQAPPQVTREWQEEKTVVVEENGKKTTKKESQHHSDPVKIDGSRISAGLHVDYRQKGLLWFSTYKVDFDGSYKFENPKASEEEFAIALPLPAQQAVYDNVELKVNDEALPLTFSGGQVAARTRLAPGTKAVLRAEYRSQGLDSWRYSFAGANAAQAGSESRSAIGAPGGGKEVTQARDFHLLVKTDFGGFDFPDNSLSPTEKRETANGWELQWDYANLVSGFDIALKMPQKLQPGPLAGRISYFAPVSLFFFFFLVFILSTMRGATMRGNNLHPMNYFFLACAFFAFHLLLAYLADHISIHAAFVISSLVSIALVVSYLRLVVDWRFAVVDAGLTQLIYLVLFSYAFFFEGFTGLAVTIGAILTLFVVMQMTGRLKWEEKFALAPENRGPTHPIAPLR